MSLVPEFELGLLNAWIITVLGFLTMGGGLFPILLIGKETIKKRLEEDVTWSEVSRTDKIVVIITHVIIIPLTIGYSVFLPLKLGTAWFYVGILISFLGIVMGLMMESPLVLPHLMNRLQEGSTVFQDILCISEGFWSM